jgi:peptidoglycan/LPS O-acetylase OafA/YrhL
MIQRQQTLWLLLSTIAATLSFLFPFVSGKEVLKTNLLADKVVDAGSDFFLLILTGGSLILSTVIIFLYNNRRQQIWLCLTGILLSLLIIFLYILQMNKLVKPILALSCVFPVFMLLGYYMAFRNIRKDEKLVKSLDKLR